MSLKSNCKNRKLEADVVVVGFGGDGAVTTIAVHDAGARVIILEKQPEDTTTEARHTPNTRMDGGAFCGTLDRERQVSFFNGWYLMLMRCWMPGVKMYSRYLPNILKITDNG